MNWNFTNVSDDVPYDVSYIDLVVTAEMIPNKTKSPIEPVVIFR